MRKDRYPPTHSSSRSVTEYGMVVVVCEELIYHSHVSLCEKT